MDDTYMTIDQAIEYLGMQRSTVWKWIRRYDIPRYRVAGDRRSYFKKTDLAKILTPQPIKKATAGISPAAA